MSGGEFASPSPGSGPGPSRGPSNSLPGTSTGAIPKRGMKVSLKLEFDTSAALDRNRFMEVWSFG